MGRLAGLVELITMYEPGISYRTPYSNPEAEEVFVPDAWRPAPLTRRLPAIVLDVTAVLCLMFGSLYIGELIGAIETDSSGEYTSGLSLLFGLVPPLGYYFVLLAKWDATPGKLLFRIKVVNHKTGGRPGILWHVLREFGMFIDWQIMGLVGLVLILSSDERRRFGDRMSDTIVVRADPEKRKGRYMPLYGVTRG